MDRQPMFTSIKIFCLKIRFALRQYVCSSSERMRYQMLFDSNFCYTNCFSDPIKEMEISLDTTGSSTSEEANKVKARPFFAMFFLIKSREKTIKNMDQQGNTRPQGNTGQQGSGFKARRTLKVSFIQFV